MPIKVTCPSCGAKSMFPEQSAGKTEKCRNCTTYFQVPQKAMASSHVSPDPDDSPELSVVEEAPFAGDEAMHLSPSLAENIQSPRIDERKRSPIDDYWTSKPALWRTVAVVGFSTVVLAIAVALASAMPGTTAIVALLVLCGCSIYLFHPDIRISVDGAIRFSGLRAVAISLSGIFLISGSLGIRNCLEIWREAQVHRAEEARKRSEAKEVEKAIESAHRKLTAKDVAGAIAVLEKVKVPDAPRAGEVRALIEQCRACLSEDRVRAAILEMTDSEFKAFSASPATFEKSFFIDEDVNKAFLCQLVAQKKVARSWREEERARLAELEKKRQEETRKAALKAEDEYRRRRDEQKAKAEEERKKAQEEWRQIAEEAARRVGPDVARLLQTTEGGAIKLTTALILQYGAKRTDVILGDLARAVVYDKLIIVEIHRASSEKELTSRIRTMQVLNKWPDDLGGNIYQSVVQAWQALHTEK